MTLLEKAASEPKQIKGKRIDVPPGELTDLAVAWVTGVITDNQAAKALGIESPSNAGSKLGRHLRVAISLGTVRVEKLR